jgi:hypothetical protein
MNESMQQCQGWGDLIQEYNIADRTIGHHALPLCSIVLLRVLIDDCSAPTMTFASNV